MNQRGSVAPTAVVGGISKCQSVVVLGGKNFLSESRQSLDEPERCHRPDQVSRSCECMAANRGWISKYQRKPSGKNSSHPESPKQQRNKTTLVHITTASINYKGRE